MALQSASGKFNENILQFLDSSDDKNCSKDLRDKQDKIFSEIADDVILTIIGIKILSE